MAENTSISWARHTFNGWIGCTKVSPACQFCYAERDWDHRFHRVKWGPKGKRSLTSDGNWKQPLIWDRQAAEMGERWSVFCNSLSDVMDDHPSIMPAWRARLWDTIARTTNLDWLPLTKRPENWGLYLPDITRPLPNVRLGVSIEDQERADERGLYLKLAREHGWKTFVSYEPACGPVDWDALMEADAIGWLIAGGESGPKARPSHPALFRQARDAAARHGVPFHFKQWGEWCEPFSARVPTSFDMQYIELANRPPLVRVGREASGRLLDGKLHDAFPRAA